MNKTEMEKILSFSISGENTEEFYSMIKDFWDHRYGTIEFNINTVKFITGGVSHNEEIIEALTTNKMFFTLCWLESKRGGIHLFKRNLNDN